MRRCHTQYAQYMLMRAPTRVTGMRMPLLIEGHGQVNATGSEAGRKKLTGLNVAVLSALHKVSALVPALFCVLADSWAPGMHNRSRKTSRRKAA